VRWQATGGQQNGRPRPEARSQSGEDALLWDLLGDREHGFFVEAGAYDGYTFSVSYVFECVGWNGVLIEPLADRAAECVQRRSSSRVISTALSAPGSPSSATFTRVPWFEMYSGFEPPDARLRFPEADNEELLVEQTAVMTLDEALGDYDGPIDFVVLDVEGHELPVLDGFNLERWRPTALLVEENDASRFGKLRRYVEARGYIYVLSLDQNYLFVRKDEDHLIQRLQSHWYDVGLISAS
jgi:FkbM family methyltransferase